MLLSSLWIHLYNARPPPCSLVHHHLQQLHGLYLTLTLALTLILMLTCAPPPTTSSPAPAAR